MNLPVLSELLERLVSQHLMDYLNSAGLLARLHSAFRTNHTTETAVLKVLFDILLAVDDGDLEPEFILGLCGQKVTMPQFSMEQGIMRSLTKFQKYW